jgi:hypothetical protein
MAWHREHAAPVVITTWRGEHAMVKASELGTHTDLLRAKRVAELLRLGDVGEDRPAWMRRIFRTGLA